MMMIASFEHASLSLIVRFFFCDGNALRLPQLHERERRRFRRCGFAVKNRTRRLNIDHGMIVVTI